MKNNNKKRTVEDNTSEIFKGINLKNICERAGVPYQKVFDAKRFDTCKNVPSEELIALEVALKVSCDSFLKFLKS